MARLSRFFAVLFSVVMLAGMIPQANAQIVVRVGHARHYRHHHYRHGHRYHR
jgi:hypothetical protein